MAKKIAGYIKLQVPAGQANPSPPIGPALGQAGLNIMEFCKAFNAATQNTEQGIPIPTVITAYADRTFYLKKAAGLPKAAGAPGKEVVGSVTMKQVREIVELKKADLNTSDMDQACKMIIGSARSMGIEVEGA